MGLYHNPSIITDGLVLALDAANIRSYSGAGTNWSDISTSLNNGTLTNGPTYGSTNGGIISFDGLDDFVQVNSSNNFPSGSAARSICIAFIPTQINVRRNCLFFHGNVDINQGFMVSSHTDGKRTQVQAYSNQASAYSNTDWVVNKLNHIVVTFNGTTITYYINGVADGTATFSTTINTVNSVNPRIASYPSGWGGESPSQGQIGSIFMYNICLTASQVQQNFNALRGRFGI